MSGKTNTSSNKAAVDTLLNLRAGLGSNCLQDNNWRRVIGIGLTDGKNNVHPRQIFYSFLHSGSFLVWLELSACGT